MSFEHYISWRIRGLTDDEIKEGFAQDSVNVSYETNYDDTTYPVISFKPEYSPYGTNGPTVQFHNPELPCNPDGSLYQPDLEKNQLFRGGFDFYPALSSDIYKCFGVGPDILAGSYNREQNVFTVCHHGLNMGTSSAFLLTYRREPDDKKAAKVAAEVAKIALHASSFTTDGGRVCDVFVLKSFVGLTVNGKLAKGHFAVEGRIKKLQRKLFKPTFWFSCIDDGVAYSDAWVLDEHGSIVPPSEICASNSRSPEKVAKQWNDLHAFDVCLYCQVRPDGTVEFCDAQVDFVWETGQSGVVTELQRRRMFLIRQQVIAKLQRNQQTYQAVLEKPVQDFPEWSKLGRI